LENCPRDSNRNQEYVVLPSLPAKSCSYLLSSSKFIYSSQLCFTSLSLFTIPSEKRKSKLNPRLILTYLIPLNLLSALIPSPALLQPHPRLQQLFTPFIRAIQSGNIREYDERLEWAQPRLVGCNVYLVVERAREGCLRVLFKKA
jgi:hypothetical protein